MPNASVAAIAAHCENDGTPRARFAAAKSITFPEEDSAERAVLLREPRQPAIGGDLRLHLGGFGRPELAVEPGEEFLVFSHRSPTMAKSAVRPRTSRLETVPIGSPSISDTSR